MKHDDEDWFKNDKRFEGTIILWKIILTIFAIFTIVALINEFC